MDAPVAMLDVALRRSVISPLLTFVLAALFVFVMTRNYIRLRREKLSPNLLDGEHVLDQLDVAAFLVTTRTIITNRRVFQMRLEWLFSRRKYLAIAFEDIHSVVAARHVNRLVLLLGLLFVGALNPLALLLVLWALEARVYSVLFDTPFSLMPRTRILVRSHLRAQLAAFERFYRVGQAIWSRVRTEKALAAPAALAVNVQETDFAWGRPLWTYLVLLLGCGFVQRVTERHLSFDDYLFGPLYIGLVAAVSQRSRRDGLWVAVLGPIALLTIKFPGWAGLDGTAPRIEEYGVLIATLMVMALSASAIAEHLSPSFSFLAVALWLAFPGLAITSTLFDLASYEKVLLAMAFAIGMARLEASRGRAWGAE